MIKTKKSLWAAGFALLVCIALLIGTTLAWFTDSVSNRGNRIQAGNLLINAYAYDLAENGAGGTFTVEGVNGGEKFSFNATAQDLRTDSTPIIQEELWEPGKSSAKLLKVENAGTLAAKIKVEFEITDGGLTDALWFDFVQVENGAVTGTFTQRPMSTIETFAENLELPLLADSEDSLEFILIYGMYENAGNIYQGKSFTADVNILATQQTYEEDGFGNPNYDVNATYGVGTAEELQAAVAEAQDNSVIKLEKDVDISDTESGRLNLGDKSLTLDLGGNQLTTGKGVMVETVESSKSEQNLLITNGDIIQDAEENDLSYNTNYALNLYTDSNTTVNVTVRGVTITADSDTAGSDPDEDGGAIVAKADITDNMNLTLEDVTVKGKINLTDCADPVINSGQFSAYDGDPYLISANIGCVINGGTFTASGNNQIIAEFHEQASHKYYINNGTFNYETDNAITVPNGSAAGNVLINGGVFNGNQYADSMFNTIVKGK